MATSATHITSKPNASSSGHPSALVVAPKDAKTRLLTMVSLNFRQDCGDHLNWSSNVPLDEFTGVEARRLPGTAAGLSISAANAPEEKEIENGEPLVILEFDMGSPPLRKSLKLADLGPLKVVSPHLVVLRIVSCSMIKGDLRSLEGCASLRTLVLHDTNVKGSLLSLERIPCLRRLNLSRTKITGSISSLGKCCELQTVVLSDTSKYCITV